MGEITNTKTAKVNMTCEMIDIGKSMDLSMAFQRWAKSPFYKYTEDGRSEEYFVIAVH